VTLVPGMWNSSGTSFKTEFISLLIFIVDGGYLEIELSLDTIVFVTNVINLDVTFEKSLIPSNYKSNGSINNVKFLKSTCK